MKYRKNMRINIKKKSFFIVSAILFIFIILVGPMDYFSHGFFGDVVEYNNISDEDRLGYIDLSQEVFEITFSPIKRHFAGFEVILENIPNESEGVLSLTTYSEEGKQIECLEININDIASQSWYKVYTKGQYRQHDKYRLILSASNCDEALLIPLVDEDYLTDESVDNNLLIGYAYSESTFTNVEKILITLFLVSIWVMMFGEVFLNSTSQRKYTRIAALVLSMTVILSWNYMFNSFDIENQEKFDSFQSDSDALVIGTIEAGRAGIESEYGLGRYYVASGQYGLDNGFITNDEWDNGYSRTEPKIMISSNLYTRILANVGTVVQFENEELFVVMEVVDNNDGNYVLTLNASGPLNYHKYGDINKASFYAIEDGIPEKFPSGILQTYLSQYGLQGKIFQQIAKHMSAEHYKENLELLCSVLTALVFCGIVIFVAIKYNLLFAGCFAITFLLSPWIVDFAASEYWVEFTWFLPMLVGVICSIWIDNRQIRRGCYVAAFITVAGKALCGYEYITAVMLGLISFLLIDFGTAVIRRNRKRIILLFRTIIILGTCAFIAFSFAISIHAMLRGRGDILNGIKAILEEDVFRRVGGGSLNEFGAEYWPSLNASVWETVRKYFRFNTDIIAGLDANLFPMLCLIPIIIFIYDYIKKQIVTEEVVMYVVFFVTGISWIVLGKSHSYIHTHINFVLWYFGFVQCCLYIIINKVWNSLRNREII